MAYNVFDLSGKGVLITGGNSGIGLGMAGALAAAGADLCIWGRSAEKLDNACAALKKHGTRVRGFKCDVSVEQEVEDRFADTVAFLGKVDACFANAGVIGYAPSFSEMSGEEWHRVLGTNLDGVFYTLRAACRHMGERGGGSCVVTSSLAAIEGQARGEHYAAAKGAIISMIRAIAVEYARYGIRANAVLPGWIETPMTDPFLDMQVFREKVLVRIPLRRNGRPEDFGGIAVYLTSDASAYHTGDTIIIDGGYSIF